MNPVVIKVENLSKKYQIGERQQYMALREEISRVLWNMVSSKSRDLTDYDAGGQIWALKDLNFSVTQGEVLGIVGHNGAGKSTLLKILSRITTPTTGQVKIKGRVGSLLEVGTGFHPELTGRENVYLNGAILGMSRREITEKFDEIVEFAEVEKFLDTPVKRYSSGMFMRLAFAVAAHLEPEILIVDEVLAVGDVEFQQKCLGKMQDVASVGRTVLFVSHNLNAIRRLCHSTIHLERGMIKAVGKTSAILDAYQAESHESFDQGQWIDTSTITRRGNSKVRVNRIRLLGDETGKITPSGPLKVTFECKADQPHKVGSVAAIIYDKSGNKLVNADSISIGKQINIPQGQSILEFNFESMPLKAGEYIFGWWIANSIRDVFDFVESGFLFKVADQTQQSFGHQPESDGVVDCNFTIDLTG